MRNKFSQTLISYFEEFPTNILFVKNPDRFLNRQDIKILLGENGIRVIEKSGIKLRIDYEINYKKEPQRTIYLMDDSDLPEDLKNEGMDLTFLLTDLFPELHYDSIINLPLTDLEILHENKPETTLNKKDTQFFIKSVLSNKQTNIALFDLSVFETKVDHLIKKEEIDWLSVIEHISNAISRTIGQDSFESVLKLTEKYNTLFQEEIHKNYQQILSASFVKKPKIVSSILKFLSLNLLDKKVALVVIDGMSFWQYQLLRDELNSHISIESDITYSWIPSITQLSRQAIFKGDYPEEGYIQNPTNEKKLWKDYWLKQGVPEYQVAYVYNEWRTTNFEKITKYAAVFTGLDDKMHSSTDYVDLKSLTINWIKKSGMLKEIQTLVESGFVIYLTTDHGNVPAKGWRNLKDDEKIGTTKTGSRSARHISYSEKWLADKFIDSNPELDNSISISDGKLYFTDLKSFSHQNELVTHGGSHLLEIIIPFAQIKHGA